MAQYTTNGKKNTIKERSGLMYWLSDLFLGNDKSDLGSRFREEFLDPNAQYADFINNMSDSELASYLDPYFDRTSGSIDWYAGSDTLNVEDVLKDLEELAKIAPGPQTIDYQAIKEQSIRDVKSADAEYLSSLDKSRQNTLTSYYDTLRSSNQGYNEMANQVLGSEYRNNANIQASMSSAMKSSRNSALEAGASAGLRLAENVNTVMSLQNKQSQVSLDTSNNLAQQLLSQRQANLGLRNDMQNSMNSYDSQQREYNAGYNQRAENLTNSNINTEQSIYDNQVKNYNDTFNSNYGMNSFANAYKNYNSNTKSKGVTSSNKYGY